jgi:hypothetical protein
MKIVRLTQQGKTKRGNYAPENVSDFDIAGFTGFDVRDERRWSGKG